jgi:methionine salvage enolase-phosphatase E1
MKSEEIRRKAMALAIGMAMIALILTIFLSIPVLAAANENKTTIYKNPISEYTQAAFPSYPPPIQEAFRHTELKKYPKSHEEFKKLMEERRGQRSWSHEEFKKLMEERRGPRSWENMKEGKEIRGTYLDITGNFETLWEESDDVDFTHALIAGDLDGDGLDDVLVIQHKFDEETNTEMGIITAKRGINGTDLWNDEVAISNGYCWIDGYPAGDLDGDGLDDVLVNIHTYDDTTRTETGQVIAKRGYDGERLWDESVSASNGYCGIWAMPDGDLDGDGLDDVLVNIYIYNDTTRTETGQVIAKRGYDGEHLWDESVSVSNGYCRIDGYPAGDLDGDGLDDVLVNIYTYNDTTDTATGQVIAKRGYDGEHLWDESVSVSNGYCEIWAMPDGDLDGDGLDDVLVNIHTYDDTTRTETGQVIAKRGYDGEHLWDESVSASNGYCEIWAMPDGDLDGDGLDDVLVNIRTYDDTTDTATGQVIAKRGYDGEHLWDESVSASNGYCWIDGYPTGDLDGDGLDDVLVNIHAYDDTTRTATGQVIAKRGYDGEHLWDESVKVSNGHCDIWAMPDGDLDGDDLDDVLVNIRTYDDTTDTATGQVIAKRGINGEHLWEESVKASNGFCWIDGYPAGDLDGDDLDDVLVNIHTYDYTTDTATGQVIAKRGYDGNLLWEATSDDYIWIAMAYPELYDYGYDPELYDYGYGNISEWGYDLNGDGINDIVLGNSNTIHAVTYAAAAPSPKISVSTDKIEYCPCDTMQIDVDISNPTENPVIFKWYLGVPTNGLWMQIWKIKLPAGFEGTIEVELHVGQWSKTPFGGVWYVDLQEPTTGKELAADCACWSYCPTGGEKVTRMPMSKPTSFKDIVKEIRKETRKEIEGIA